MIRKQKLPELLAPAGDFECLYAAVSGGADAIYVGGRRFGARAYAKNFDIEELRSAVSYCHLHSVKLYVTVNTLVEDKEMAELIEYVGELWRIGVDALIIADLGAIAEIKRYFPDFEIHASTQMSIHNSLGADEAAKLGCTRVVPARELSLADIRSVTRECVPEVEVFLHGALCVCYSGQCLFSSLVGGRSGNRGECAQPCRLPYNGGKYPLSLKDLSLSGHIPALIESGVASLKIEGRMKSPDYVYTVTSIYRRLLDENRSATPAEDEKLRRAFSRDGFTDGYFVGKLGNMTGIRTKEDKRDSIADGGRHFEPERVKIGAKVEIKLGVPSVMTVTDGKRTATAHGEIALPAKNAPLDEVGVKARLSKMGNTSFILAENDIELSLDEGVNLAPSALNALRRLAAERLSDFTREPIDVVYTPQHPELMREKFDTAQFFSAETFLSAVDADSELLDDFDAVFVPLFSPDEAIIRAGGVALPPVILDSELDEASTAISHAASIGAKYALVSNIGHIPLAKKYGMIPIGDFRLNVTNSESAHAYRSLGVGHVILSPELTLPKVRDIGGGVIVYGRIPLMLTERCFMKESFGCNKCSSCSLTDRRGEKFPMMREWKHRNIIFNSAVTYALDKPDELSRYKIASKHFLFTVESGERIVSVYKASKSGKPLSENVRRIGRRDI